jgi:hypothetical protein
MPGSPPSGRHRAQHNCMSSASLEPTVAAPRALSRSGTPSRPLVLTTAREEHLYDRHSWPPWQPAQQAPALQCTLGGNGSMSAVSTQPNIPCSGFPMPPFLGPGSPSQGVSFHVQQGWYGEEVGWSPSLCSGSFRDCRHGGREKAVHMGTLPQQSWHWRSDGRDRHLDTGSLSFIASVHWLHGQASCPQSWGSQGLLAPHSSLLLETNFNTRP